MPKSKACHHPLSEGWHPLQGDKHKKQFVRGDIWYQCCIQKKRVFLVYRLAVDATPCRGDDVAGWKYLSLLKDFQPDAASMARKRHFASTTRGFSGFCLSCRHRSFLQAQFFQQAQAFRSDHFGAEINKHRHGTRRIGVFHGCVSLIKRNTFIRKPLIIRE